MQSDYVIPLVNGCLLVLAWLLVPVIVWLRPAVARYMTEAPAGWPLKGHHVFILDVVSDVFVTLAFLDYRSEVKQGTVEGNAVIVGLSVTMYVLILGFVPAYYYDMSRVHRRDTTLKSPMVVYRDRGSKSMPFTIAATVNIFLVAVALLVAMAHYLRHAHYGGPVALVSLVLVHKTADLVWLYKKRKHVQAHVGLAADQ
jgi:hypothetical protein